MSAPSSSLRPGWSKGTSGGRGFQPPPTVADRGEKGRSSSWGSQEKNNANKFAALDEDEDGFITVSGKAADEKQPPASNSRSEAFRSSFGRQTSTGSRASGRSLADLAAQVPEPPGGLTRRPGRFSNLRTTSEGGNVVAGSSSSSSGGAGGEYKPDPKVTRYTREKLLSIRPIPKANELPEVLQEIIGTHVVTESAQDPVCWDTFDSEEIWELFRERRIAAGIKTEAVAGTGRPEISAEPRRRPVSVGGGGGRWQRGVALPPPEEAARKKNEHASNAEELWDDPGGTSGAAADFSAFGAMPADDDGGEFDFDKMAEATRKMDEELHGTSRHEEADAEQTPGKSIDTTRPLASAGMTITSGSGDNVNVFEDFDDPAIEAEKATETTEAPVRSATEDPTASSRLMKMIGVEPPKAETATGDQSANPWGDGNGGGNPDTGIDSIFGSIGGLSLNPWGGGPNPAADSTGVDLTGRLAAEQKAREEQLEIEKRARQEAELRRRQQEEAQRQAIAQRQAAEQARVAAVQQQPTQQSQVELVLMERICSILENSWGRSDLVSILSTLHSEDSRVIPLLGNIDLLRALIARSPQRVALRRDPSFNGDMAVLLLTNQQWQLQQQEVQTRKLEEARLAQSRPPVQILADRPWFYSDPQSNIQGPFRGDEMRQWLEAGYFKGDLPISQQPSGPFHPLSMLFPNLNAAFVVERSADLDAKKDIEKRAMEEQKRKEKAEEERRATEAAEAAEREKQAAAAAAAAQAAKRAAEEEAAASAAAVAAKNATAETDSSAPSTQLKMMLGLPGAKKANAVPETEGASQPTGSNALEKKSQKAKKKAPQAVGDAEPTTKAPAPVSATPKPAAAAWGGSSSAKPKKSMSEIQQEEARRAAIEAAKGGGQRQSSNGWANVAAGTQGWSNGIVKKTTSKAPVTNVASSIRPVQASTAGKSATKNGTGKANKTSTNVQQTQQSSTGTSVEDFGATMSPSLEAWCKEQMTSLTGSDDLTLIAFCMTLTDANEIRQYLQAYLGNGGNVNSFASEFINRRGLGNKQEEWETPGSAKKGRKKKNGPR